MSSAQPKICDYIVNRCIGRLTKNAGDNANFSISVGDIPAILSMFSAADKSASIYIQLTQYGFLSDLMILTMNFLCKENCLKKILKLW